MEEIQLNAEINEEDTQKGRFLTFTLGNEYYGIDIIDVTEIVGIQPITVVPELPEFIKGIINLRGKITPVIDMRLKFNKKTIDYNDRTCIIVTEVNNQSIGIIVDAVSEVVTIDDDAIVPPPNMNTSNNKYIKNIGKTQDLVVLIIDCQKIFTEDQKEILTV